MRLPQRVRLGHSAMSAQCPVSPKAEMPGQFMSTRLSYDLARTVVSPMAMLFDEVMTLRSITFTQDRNRGTLSVLDLVNPRLLNGQKTFDVGDYTDPKDGKILDTAPAIWQHGIKSVT